ncbi:hypothetical protein LCGC14_2734780, partial [marine sediment metagenome]
HGREMWDERYSDICDLLKKARKLLHDIEREAEAAEGQQQGQEAKQVVGKADPSDTPPKPGFKEQAAYPRSQSRPTFLRRPPTGKRPPMYKPTAGQAQRSVGKVVRKAAKAAAGR